MSRPWVLVCLLLLIVFSSQLEWRQQYENELEAGPNATQSEPHVSDREEAVKEKIILSQERNIRRLNELVQSLRTQLLQCRGEHEAQNSMVTPMTELLTVLDQQPLLDD
ncbi:hypothetical protein SDJN03_09775, partial [Cucurbita argyrosperma subsp. sororia]